MKMLTVVGARPQFIKASAVSRAISSSPELNIDEVMVHTGQHYDDNMSKIFFDELEQTTILELATMISELTGNRMPFQLRPARNWDRSGKRFAPTRKAEVELGFHGSVDTRDGLRRTVEWTPAKKQLIAPSIARHKKQLGQAGNGC